LALSTIECQRTGARPPRRRAPDANPNKSTFIPAKGKVRIVSVSIQPLEDRVVVKSLEAEQTTASGLVIPDTAKEKPQEGEVLAVGDRVIYSKYGGTEIKHGGEEFLILSARDVLAKIG
jgi:chaperonin GroES